MKLKWGRIRTSCYQSYCRRYVIERRGDGLWLAVGPNDWRCERLTLSEAKKDAQAKEDIWFPSIESPEAPVTNKPKTNRRVLTAGEAAVAKRRREGMARFRKQTAKVKAKVAAGAGVRKEKTSEDDISDIQVEEGHLIMQFPHPLDAGQKKRLLDLLRSLDCGSYRINPMYTVVSGLLFYRTKQVRDALAEFKNSIFPRPIRLRID